MSESSVKPMQLIDVDLFCEKLEAIVRKSNERAIETSKREGVETTDFANGVCAGALGSVAKATHLLFRMTGSDQPRDHIDELILETACFSGMPREVAQILLPLQGTGCDCLQEDEDLVGVTA